MDLHGKGNARLPMLMMKGALIAVCASVLACAQPPADAQGPQENEMQGTPPTQDDIRAEQDRAAALADQAAVDASGQARSARQAEDPVPLPKGPVLSTDRLETAIARLAAELKGPEQTQPAFVGQTFGVSLAPESAGERTGVQGALGSGTYTIEVETLYPGAPGQHVSIMIDPPSNCVLSFARISEQLDKAGYQSQKSPRSMDPSVSFSKDVSGATAFVELDVDSHDAPKCIWQVEFDLEAKDV